MTGKLTLELVADSAADVTQKLTNVGGTPHKAINTVIDMMAGASSGNRPAFLRLRVDDSTGTSATQTVAVTYGSLAANDFLRVQVGSKQTLFTCVSTTPAYGSNQFQKQTDATTTGNNLRDAINQSPDMAGVVTATASTGTVTLTSTAKGGFGNAILLGKSATSGLTLGGSSLAGAVEPGSLTTVGVTVSVNPTNGHTFSIGGKTLTFVASSANENQVTIGGSAAGTAANLLAIINANSVLSGLVLASDSGTTAKVNLTLQQSGRIGQLVALTQSHSDLTLTASTFSPATTEVPSLSTLNIVLGRSAA